MLAIWLVEAMSQTVAATLVVQRERVHIILYLNAEKRKGKLEWKHNYLYVWINLLSLSPLPERAQLLVEIKKKSSSIEEVMEELHSIDGVNCGSALHTFATEFFCSTSKREM
jgi:hypothetical protein